MTGRSSLPAWGTDVASSTYRIEYTPTYSYSGGAGLTFSTAVLIVNSGTLHVWGSFAPTGAGTSATLQINLPTGFWVATQNLGSASGWLAATSNNTSFYQIAVQGTYVTVSNFIAVASATYSYYFTGPAQRS